MNLKKILKYTGYAVFGILIFIFFCYLNFPYYKVKDKIFLQIEKQSGWSLDAEDFKTTLFLGVKFSNLTIQSKRTELAPLNIPVIDIQPSLLSLVMFKPKIHFLASFIQGSLEGSFHQKERTNQNLDIKLNGIDLKKQFQEYLPMDLSGTLEGEIALNGNLQTFQGLQGETQFQIKKFVLGKTSILGMELPPLSLAQIILKGNIKKDQFVIEKFEAGSDQDNLKASLLGDIALNPQSFNNSRLNLKLKFKMSDTLKEEFKLFLPLLSGALDPSGYYNLNITGTLEAPMALPTKS